MADQWDTFAKEAEFTVSKETSVNIEDDDDIPWEIFKM